MEPNPSIDGSAEDGLDKLDREVIGKISGLIPNIDGQTEEDRERLIRTVYKKKYYEIKNHPEWYSENGSPYFRFMEDFYFVVAHSILDPQSPPSSFEHSDIFRREFLLKKTNESARISALRIAESKGRRMMMRVRKKIFKSMIEEALKSKQST